MLKKLSLSAVVVLAGLSTASAQMEQMFDRMDRNRDGVLDEQEFPSQWRGRMGLGGGNISRDDMTSAVEKMRAARGGGGAQGGGGFSRGGTQGGGGFSRGGSTSGGRSGFSRGGGDTSGRGGFSGRGGEQGGRFGRGGDTKAKSGPKMPERIQVTLDLPGAFLDGDLDRDGQVALYEWRKWKGNSASMIEFFALDANHDGFLTPREGVMAEKIGVEKILAEARAKQPQMAAGSQPAPATASTGAPSSGSTASTDSSSPAPSAASTAVTAATKSQGERYFKLLDRNKNQMIDESEWKLLKKMKPKFEERGADLTQGMDKETFLGHFTAIKAAES